MGLQIASHYLDVIPHRIENRWAYIIHTPVRPWHVREMLFYDEVETRWSFVLKRGQYHTIQVHGHGHLPC